MGRERAAKVRCSQQGEPALSGQGPLEGPWWPWTAGPGAGLQQGLQEDAGVRPSSTVLRAPCTCVVHPSFRSVSTFSVFSDPEYSSKTIGFTIPNSQRQMRVPTLLSDSVRPQLTVRSQNLNLGFLILNPVLPDGPQRGDRAAWRAVVLSPDSPPHPRPAQSQLWC